MFTAELLTVEEARADMTAVENHVAALASLHSYSVRSGSVAKLPCWAEMVEVIVNMVITKVA